MVRGGVRGEGKSEVRGVMREGKSVVIRERKRKERKMKWF